MEDLKAFIDGELAPERAAEIQAAIDRDHALRKEYEFMKLLSSEIKSMAREPQAAGAEKVIGNMPRRRSFFAGWKAPSYALGGVCALFLIGLVGSVLFPVFAQSKAAAKMSQALSDAKKADLVEGLSTGSLAKPAPSEAPTGDLERSPQIAGQAIGGGGKGLSESEGKAKAMGYYTSRTKSDTTLPQPQGFASPRKVIRTADMGIKVKEVRKAVADAEDKIDAMGGYVGNTNYSEAESTSTATMEFKIPEKNFTTILDDLRHLGKVYKEHVSGEDVTANVADLDGRVRALADEERNLVEELQRTRNSEVRLEIRSRLSSVRQEMESLKEQNKQMKDLASLSRVTVEFQQAGQLDESKADDWFNQTTEGAGGALGFFGRIVGVGLIYTLFLAPIWAPIAGIAWWMRRKARLGSSQDA
ncbi:MAG: DUF4349 domain-containing protein [Armatimonadetes bacterium]|nr:DUF4349 domain-containing protein [Armatimonadota bacterium]